MTFGEKLQKLRRSHGWTQENVAERIGVSRQTFSRWEADAVRPDTDNVIHLSDLFGVTVDYLLRESTMPQPCDVSATLAAEKKQKNNTLIRRVCGLVIAMLSCGGLLWLAIAASLGSYEILYPGPNDGSGAIACMVGKTGLAAMLEIYHLRWLFWLLILTVVIGVLLAMPHRAVSTPEADQEHPTEDE